MHFLSMGDAFDWLDALAILMLVISLLVILASVRITKMTERLAAANRLNWWSEQDRHQKLRQRYWWFYRSVGERQQGVRPRT
jgi:phage gp46-like protein